MRMKLTKRMSVFVLSLALLLASLLDSNETVYAADIYKLSYNESNISAVGKQGSQQCMAYALAYCRTILDGYTHVGTEYWQSGVGGMYGKADYTTAGATTQQGLLKIVYDQINAGLPVCMYVTGQYRQNRNWKASGDHWVTVVGYKTSANPNQLKISDFYILDPGSCSYDYLYDDINCIKLSNSALRISNSGTTIVSPYNNVYVNNISDNNAQINAELTSVKYCSSCGFYISKNFDMSDSMRINEDVAMNVKTIWYDMNKWNVSLEAGTTYYYQFYIVSNGNEVKSDIQSFTTTGDSQVPVITDIKVENVTSDGYTVTCLVTDNVGVARVCFPTWTEDGGQDDLNGDWYNNCAVYPSGAGNTYTFRVNVADHGYAGGLYNTHIYAYDTSGNYSIERTTATVIRDIALESISLSSSSMKLSINETQQLVVTAYTPSNTTADKTATWTSSNTSVAAVDSQGNVTGLKAGTATITCTVAGISQNCNVTVSDEILQAFSGWVDSLPSSVTSNSYEVQQKTQYRYRTKSETTSTTANLSGWTVSNEWWGDWISCGSDVTQTSTREVKTEQQYVKTQYAYNHWHNNSTGYISPVQYSGWVYHETGWLDTPLTAKGTSSAGGTKYASSVGLGACGYDTWWYNQSTQDVYNTLYYYRDKYFQYYQWSGWSAWSDNAAYASSNVEVETKTVYRYRYIGAQILSQPAAQNVEEGSTATFTVGASGSGLSYQWQESTDGGLTWKNSELTGNTTKTLTVEGLKSRNGNQYRCVVTSVNGDSVISAVAELKVFKVLKITTQPTDTQVKLGQTVRYTTKASGDGLSYQWYYKRNGQTSYTKWSGKTSSTLSFNAKNVHDGLLVYCVITDQYGKSVETKVVSLTVKPAIEMISHPESISAKVGAMVKYTVKASGDGLSYQWYYKRADQTTYTKWSGRTSSTLAVTAKSNYDGLLVYCVITDEKGNSVTTETARLTLKEQLKIDSQPQNICGKKGSTAKFTVGATGDGLKYQWYYKRADQTEYTLWSGRTSATLSFTAKKNYADMQVYCVVTDENGNSVQTQEATLTLKAAAAITGQPESVTVKAGENVKFTVSAIGDGLKYQWYYKRADQTEYTLWNGRTSAVLSFTAKKKYADMQVYCVVTDENGNSVQTQEATLTLKAAAAITGQPESVTAKAGENVKFTVSATGDGLKYQWYYKRADQTEYTLWNGRTSAVLSFTAKKNYADMQVYCVVTDEDGHSAESEIATLTLVTE